MKEAVDLLKKGVHWLKSDLVVRVDEDIATIRAVREAVGNQR